MSITLKPGSRLYSAVCTTEVIVVKAPASPVELTIGGVVPVSSLDQRSPDGAPAVGHGEGSVMGKRYVDEAGTMELLCTKAGLGSIALDGTPLGLKDAKPLPASD